VVAGCAAGVAAGVEGAEADVAVAVAGAVGDVAADVAVVAAEVTVEVADVAADVTSDVGKLAACACREKASRTARMPTAKIATCIARRAMRRSVGWGTSHSRPVGTGLT
jgi:hypothetical protein